MKATRKQENPQRASGSPRGMPVSSMSPVAWPCHHQASRRAACTPHCSDTVRTDTWGHLASLPHKVALPALFFLCHVHSLLLSLPPACEPRGLCRQEGEDPGSQEPRFQGKRPP